MMQKILEHRERAEMVNICGGEVLLYPDKVKHIISVTVAGCKKESVPIPSFEVSTNASLLTDDLIAFFEEHKVSLFIGYDGISASQNQNRVLKNSGAGTFEKCFSSLKHLHLKNPTNHITINTVISSNNVHWLNESFDFLYNEFPNFSLSLNVAFNTAWDDHTLHVLDAELHTLAEKYVDIIATKNPNFSLGIFDKQISLGTNAALPVTYPRCGACETTFGVTPEGYIEACTQLTGLDIEEYCIVGNLAQGLNPGKVKVFRDSLLNYANITTCTDCDLKVRCYNYCPSTNYLSSRDIYAVSPSQCEISKILIYASDFVLNELESRMPSIIEPRFLQR
jgi:uncharacterized protein